MNDTTTNNGSIRRARDKIKTLSELASVCDEARHNGRRVALCHGVFDLVHLGHVRHLEAARREGDVLVVTVTADCFVNKGPGRPIFPDHMRAEMLAALEYVDYVAVLAEPSAESALHAVQPDVYVKGSDYENPEDDITGKIVTEREAVENHGGRLVYTKDITFSSSSLINRYLDVYDPPLRDYLETFRSRTTLKDLLDLIESVRDYRVLLIGDTIIDEYRYIETLGRSAKENIIATRHLGHEIFAGGVIATANHVANLCREVEIVTSFGTLDSYEELVRTSLHSNVRLNPIYRDGIPTTRKCRYVDATYTRKLFEVYHFDDSPPPAAVEDNIVRQVAERANAFDVVIAADFGHGAITGRVVNAICRHARFLAVNAQTNAGNQGFNLITKYPRADYVCVSGPEARLAVADKYSDLAVIAGELLPKAVRCPRLIVTGGHHGCVSYDSAIGVQRAPAFTKTVVDTVGAGDALLAITSPLVAAGAPMEHVAFVGNAAGAIKVGIVGHRKSVEKIELIKFITTLMK
jgi:rfaE bifunctional protein nucleotidyltransferase chain/domain